MLGRARLREAASLEKHVLLKKLRDALESLKGRVAGRNKDDVEDAIAMVEALAVQLTQREGELIQEKAEVKKLANFLKQTILGGATIGIVLNENTTFQQLVQEVEGKLGKSLMGKIFKYTLDFDKTKLIDLVSDACLKDLIYFSGRISQLYVFQREMPDIFNSIEDQPQNIVELECGVNTSADKTPNLRSTLDASIATQCTSASKSQFMCKVWQEEIIGNGQSFKDAHALSQQDALN
ncbi:hypothetical protein COLO4_27766 [Corchorus olitorius]|uniref:Stomatal closure-related actin-binding protein coiled-coil domain-containing protein n=1 Tax=Corchorus olitorius TaxID=93759 RepID=A0A1R3HP52_9ROSI|nr:hypothetical protein COLO4_27766 [Corchorus olitorius]